MEISIVIACYNEATHLKKSVADIQRIMDSTKWSYEFIFIDDSSSDGTQDILKEIQAEHPEWQFYFHEVNMGRGRTVTEGFFKSHGSITGFIDIDLEVPAYIIPALAIEIQKMGYDIATAKRDYRIHFQIIHRWMASRCYNFLVRKFLKINLEDTESGCKFFSKNKLLPILKHVKDPHWFWDTEIMVRCYKERYRIKELPALFIRKPDKKSTVNFISDIKDYLIKIYKFRKELKKIS